MHRKHNFSAAFSSILISIAFFPAFVLPWFIKSGIQTAFTTYSFLIYSVLIIFIFVIIEMIDRLTAIPAELPEMDQIAKRSLKSNYYITLMLIAIGTILSIVLEKMMLVRFFSIIFPAGMLFYSVLFFLNTRKQDTKNNKFAGGFLIAVSGVFYLEKSSVISGLESFPVLYAKAIIFWLFILANIYLLLSLNYKYQRLAKHEIESDNTPAIAYENHPSIDFMPFLLLLILVIWSFKNFVYFSPWNMIFTLAPLAIGLFVLNQYNMNIKYNKASLILKVITLFYLAHFVFYMSDLHVFKSI